MYGLIHNAMRQMITENYGNEVWEKVVRVSGVPQESFITVQSYEDSIAYSLAGSISDVLNVPLDQCLSLFGEYWLTKFAPSGYEMLLRASGNNLFDFLENLDNLHDRITTTFTGYTPPGFKLIRKSPNSATLVYTSSRHGLTAFVHGLLLGMQTRFNIDIEFVSIQTSTSDKGDRTVFELVTRTRN